MKYWSIEESLDFKNREYDRLYKLLDIYVINNL